MQREPPRKGGGSGTHSPLSFEGKLEKEEEILDMMLVAHARGQLPADAWEKLHKAAQRDERLSELAFAYESVSQGKRLKALSGAPVAEFLLQAAHFFGDVFGDEFGAATYLERALSAVPGHQASFEMLDRLLTKAKNWKRLAEICVDVAKQRPRAEELVLLRRAAELFEKAAAGAPASAPGQTAPPPGGGSIEEKIVELYQQILRLDPTDENARNQLEARYLKANRVRDVARLLEMALGTDPPPQGRAARKLHARLLELYANVLHEPERSIPHVEALLEDDPSHDEARRIAQKLVVIKGLAARAAAALAKACSSVGTPAEVARFLQIELEHTRGPKRREVLMKIGILKQERMGDEKGAFDSFEQALALDASDDELRARYGALAQRLNKQLDAAKTLMRVGSALKDPAQKAKTSAEMGLLMLAGGEVKRAKQTLVGVLAQADAGPEATLAAARALADIHEKENDKKALADVLERLGQIEPDPEAGRVANERLAELAAQLGDTPRAIAAYKRLLPTSSRAIALAALAPLFEASGDANDLALILEERSKDAPNLLESRRLAFKAAEVRTTQTKDVAAASAAWKRFVEKFGSARDVHALWLPLLEAQRDWSELASALRADAQLAPDTERLQILTKLGSVLLTRVRDVPGAIDAFRRVLSIDAQDKNARATLEKLATAGEARLLAAAALEPIYRAEGNAAALLKILDAKAQLAPEPRERLFALEEATQLAAHADPARALDFAGRGLAEAASVGEPLAPWIERIDQLPHPDAKKRAGILAEALGGRSVDSPELLFLAKRAGEAHARAGDVTAALDAYRRALAYEPSSEELIAQVDELLRDQGSPHERIALHRSALDRELDMERRKELLHRIGRIEKNDLRDVPAAIATYRAVLHGDPDDAEAHAMLVELYAEAAEWHTLCELLETRLARVSGDEARRVRAELAEVAAAHGESDRARAHSTRLMEDESLGDAELDAVERVADLLSDADLARDVLRRRAATTADPHEQVKWLEKLGELESDRRGDLDAAATSWRQAARVAEAAGDDERARHLYARVRKVAPEDRDATERLVDLHERAELWSALPPLYMLLLEHATERDERVTLLLKLAHVQADRLGLAREAAGHAARAFELAPASKEVLAAFERHAIAAGSHAEFERAIDEALSMSARGEDEMSQRAEMRLAKARVLASDPARHADAARAYRTLLEDPAIDDAKQQAALAGFEALVVADEIGRREDRRWLLAWRTERAGEADKVQALLAWAQAEETQFQDPARALEIHKRTLAIDPENADALAATSRLALALGDVEGALAALAARRDRSEGPARNALDLEIASTLLDKTDRVEDALAPVRSVLESAPQDQVALSLASRLLAAAQVRSQAIALLEQACEHAEDPDVRAQILTCLLDAPPAPPHGEAANGTTDAAFKEMRRQWYERLLELHHAQGKLELALATVVRAAAELPTVDALWDRAEALARELKRPDEVATLYQTVLAQSLAQDRGLALGERAVAFYEEWFEEPGRVVGILERVLEIDPTAQWAFDRLKLLFDAAERWDDLFALFDRALPAAQGQEKIELLEEAAQVAKDFADRPDRAIGYLEQLVVLKPNDARLSAALERLYERQSRHRELITLLGARLPHLSAKDAHRTRARIARLWIEELADPASALGIVEEMLGSGVSDPEIDVNALLERILSAAPPGMETRGESIRPSEPPPPRSKRGKSSAPPPPKKTSVRQRAAAVLKERYAESKRELDLVRMLEIELEAIKSVKERIRRHQQIATLYQNLGNDQAALEQYVALVTLEPDVATHRVRLAELAEKVDRFDRLAEVLAAAADDCADDALRVELLMQAGVVQSDRLGDGDRAIELFSRVLATEGAPVPAVLAAARRLDPLLEAARRPQERLYVLERIASIEPEANARRAALGTAARLATDLEEHERALAAWQARLDEDAKDVEALDGMVALLERLGRHERLIEALDQRARAPIEGERRRADRVRIAELYAQELGRADDAVHAWRAVEEEFGPSDESTRALALLLRASGRWSELAGLLGAAAQRAQDPSARAELLHQLGDVLREQIGDHARAVEAYEGALDADVHSGGARAGLHALLADDAQRPRVVAVLMKAYEATDAWQLTLELTAHRLLAAQDDAERLAVLRHAAVLAEQRANDVSLAFEAMRRAFLLAAGDPEVERELVRLGVTTDSYRALADTYADALVRVEQLGQDGALAAHLRFELGKLLEDRLDDAKGALNAYLRIVQDDAARSMDAATSAVRVAGSLGRWDAAARVVVDVSRAMAGTDPALVEAVEQAASRGGAWDALTSTLAAVVSESDLPPKVARDLEAQLAVWHRDRRGDPDAAEAALVRALVHEPLDAHLLAALTRLQRRAKGRPLVDSLLRLSQATGGDLELLREAAEIARDIIGDRALLRSILEKLVALGTARWVGGESDAPITMGNPAPPAPYVEWASDELVKALVADDEHARAVDVLVSTAKLPFDVNVSRAMRHRAARIAVDDLGDQPRGIALYTALFDDDPEDEEAVDRLVALYRTAGRSQELLALRERQIAVAKSPERRVALRLPAARLLHSTGEHDRALAMLRENLGESPRDDDTVKELTLVLDALGRFKPLYDLFVDQATLADQAGDREAAAELWFRAAIVAEEKLGDRGAATKCHERVVAIEPRAASFDALARLATTRGDHAEAAEHLLRLRDVAPPAERANVVLRLAEALLSANRPDDAEARLEEACAAEPADEALRARLGALHRQRQSWRKLAQLTTVAAAHAPDKATRLARLREAAVLLTRNCAAPEEAIPLLEQASDLEPNEQSIRLALADALGAAKRFDEARAALKVLIESFGGRRPKERAPVHYHLAQLELAMGNRARALVELDAATRIDPANPEILRNLAELARDDAQLERAERSYRALLVVLRRQDEATDESTVARSEVLLELSTIAERQGQSDRAKEILESALEAATRSAFEEHRLEDALRARGDDETLVRALEARLARAEGTADALPALTALAEALDARAGRPGDALPLRLRAIALEPASDAAHDAALSLARRLGDDGVRRYVEALRALAKDAEASDAAVASRLLLRLGGVLENDVKDDAAAAATYEQALAIDQHAKQALGALDRVYERLGDADAQARVLSKRIALESTSADPRGATDALYRLAQLRLSSKATIEQGCDLLADALARAPELDRAEEALRKAVQVAPTHARVLDLYEQVGRNPGHERALVDALVRRSELPGATGAELREAVELATRIDDRPLAEQLLTKFVESERTASQNVENIAWALATLGDLRAAAGDLRQAVDLKKGAADLAEPETSRRLSFEVAKIASESLHDLPLAAQTFEKLLARDPADREAWEPLLGVYREMNDPQKLAALLASVVEYVEDPAERSKLRLERVRVMMKDLGMGDDAAQPLREIVDEDPSQVEAAMMLANILERTGRDEDLADLLSNQIDAAKDRSDAASVASLALRLGALLEKRDPVAARNVYYTGLDWDPSGKPLLEALVRLLAEHGEPAERADAMERLLAIARGQEAEDLALALHQLRVDQWDDLGAERALELGFRAHPQSFVLKQRLETAYRDRKAWLKLADLCVVDALARVSREEKIDRLREAAAIHRNELRDARSAADVLRKARAASPEDAALLGELVAMLAEAGEHRAAADEITEALAALPEDAPAKSALLAQRAQLRAALGDDDGALDDLDHAYAIDPATHAAELGAQLQRSIARATDPARQRELRLRLVQLLPRTGDVDGARAIASDLLKHDPKDTGALRAVAQLEEHAQKWDAASAALRRLVALEDAPSVVGTALRLADACEHANRVGDARGGLERARMMAPGDESLRKRLEKLYEQTGAFRELAEMYLADAGAAGDVAGRYALLLKSGALMLQHVGDPEAALLALREAHALRPGEHDCTVLLADAYTAAGRTVEASELLQTAIAAHKGRRSRELAALYHRLALVARADGEHAAELSWLTQSMDMDSQNGAVASALAQLAMDMGQLDLANRALRIVTMLKNPAPMSKALAYQYMGEIARKQGDPKRAVMLLKRAVQEDPTLAGARALLEHLSRE